MVCKNCGARLPKGARRCPRCGRRAAPARGRAGAFPRLGLALAAGTIVILVAAICAALFSGDGKRAPEYAQVLDRYFAALEKRDAEAYATTRPEAYIDYLTREGGPYLNRTVYLNSLTETIDARMNGYAAVCGSGIRIRYSIDQALDMAPLAPRISGILASWYGFPPNSVAGAVLVTGSYTVRGSSDAQRFEIGETLLLKIGESWYFAPDIGQSWRD